MTVGHSNTITRPSYSGEETTRGARREVEDQDWF